MLQITQSSGWLATIIVCQECPHVAPAESDNVWIDTNGDTFFTGESVEELAKFLATHALASVAKAFYALSPEPIMCKCGHGFSDHSFYGETRGECHGERDDNRELQCECGYFTKMVIIGQEPPTIPPAGMYPDTI